MTEPIALIGGRGYMGQALAKRLEKEGIAHWIVGRQSQPDILHSGESYRSSVPHLGPAIAGARTVFHLATLSTPALGYTNPFLDVENIHFTISLIGACEKEKVGHIIFISSGGTVYGEATSPRTEEDTTHPICSHGIGKLACEHYLNLFARHTGADVTILRVGNVYGGSQRPKGQQGVVGYIRERLTLGQTVNLFGNTVRDYVHLDDVLDACLIALKNPQGFRVYNIATGIGTELVKIVDMAAQFLRIEPHISMSDRRPFDLAYNVLDCTKAMKGLGWIARTFLSEGLQRSLF
ncbi:MAG: NAD-dependent epimerase/dehydratase family protein [Syntrophales bacterium]|nr:NAD-dependent epimerase/dehydratase family protein [Syntrophales bacterium]